MDLEEENALLVNQTSSLGLAALLTRSIVKAEENAHRVNLSEYIYDAEKVQQRSKLASAGQEALEQLDMSPHPAEMAMDYEQHLKDPTFTNNNDEDMLVDSFSLTEVTHGDLKDEGNSFQDNSSSWKQHVEIPRSIHKVPQNVRDSGVAIYPGGCDRCGSTVIFIFCNHAGWHSAGFLSPQLAQLILYYTTLSRLAENESCCLVVDARATTLHVLDMLLETIYTVQTSSSNAISIVHVLADKVARNLLFKKSVFNPHFPIKMDLLNSMDALSRVIDISSELPTTIDGGLKHDHASWVSFRMVVEPFICLCQNTALKLSRILEKMTTFDKIPESPKLCQKLIKQHQIWVKETLNDEELKQLQMDGYSKLERIDAMKQELHNCKDFRGTFAAVQELHHCVQDTLSRLIKLVELQLSRLNHFLQLRQIEDQAAQVICWIQNDGNRLLKKYNIPSDNLRASQMQKNSFDKFYFEAMRQLEIGNSVLDQVESMFQAKDQLLMPALDSLKQELQSKMNIFSSHIEFQQQRIERTSRCYNLLDKSYEWALAAMKYAASMKMNKNGSLRELSLAITALDRYLHENPPISDDKFDEMEEIALELKQERLQEQCQTARARCCETSSLLRTRQNTLQRAMAQLELEQQHQQEVQELHLRRRSSLTASGCNAVSLGLSGNVNEECSTWVPKMNVMNSTHPPPVHEVDASSRRRSYAGRPSAPMHSLTGAAFKDALYDMNIMESEEYNESFFTQDFSDHVVTSLPKTLADSLVHGSRESLKGSCDSLKESHDEPDREQKSKSLPQDLTAYQKHSRSLSPPPIHTISYNIRPRKPRTGSLLTGASGEVLDHKDLRWNARTVSMITGSNESLPSMPEEEEQNLSDGQVDMDTSKNLTEFQTPKESSSLTMGPLAWSTPVTVNSHLNMATSPSKPVSQLSRFHSMADLRLTEEETKRKKTLSLIMQEMVQTEYDYVQSLQYIRDNYLTELNREHLPQMLMGKRNIIFGNIEKLCEFHSRVFLAELKNAQHNPFSVGKVFLCYANNFDLYALYNKNKPKSDELMSDCGTKFFRRKQLELGDKMDLNSYLLKPVQRMGKYALLLKQILEECASSDPDHNNLRNALDMVKFQLRHGNDLLVMDGIRDCDVNLQEQGQLLRQEEFLVWQGRKKSLRRVFLFEEMLVFTKAKHKASGHDIYIYKSSIKSSDYGLTETVSESRYKFMIWFRKRTDKLSYLMQAPNMEIKNAWVRDISRLLWRQAIQNRERRMTEMARMGIGSKPCLDLKPSKDNIHDRNIGAVIAPQSRNSIAISSFESRSRHGTKRPHSIISFGSVASGFSGSTQSSGYETGGSTHSSGYNVPKNPLRSSSATNTDLNLTSISRSNTTLPNERREASNESPSSPATDAFTQTTLKRGASQFSSTTPTPDMPFDTQV